MGIEMTLGIPKLKSSLFYCDYVHLLWSFSHIKMEAL